MQITIFIDYDNLLEPQKKHGVLDVVSKALLTNPLATHDTRGRCNVRLYGGWYEGSSLTTRAQELSAEIQATFPTVIRAPSATGHVVSLSTQAELAYAMSIEPTRHLLETFRVKQFPYNIKHIDPVQAGCTQSSCSLSFIPPLFKKGCCPNSACSLSIKKILYRSEQKLVDTMLTCDIVYSANQPNDLLVIVSGDDDILPAARTADLLGKRVLRIHPKPFLVPHIFSPSNSNFTEAHF